MEVNKFNKLLETTELEKIIRMHYSLKISLTSKQLDKILNLKNKKENENWKN